MVQPPITFLRTKKFFQSYPIILFFQHNNLTVKEWAQLRRELQKSENTSLCILKNSVTEHLFFQSKVPEPKFDSIKRVHSNSKMTLFQGPCFAIGFLKMEMFQNILKLTTVVSNIILIGGFFNNTFVNHCDIRRLRELDKTIYTSLFLCCAQDHIFYESLKSSIDLRILNQTALQLIDCLETMKQKMSDLLYIY